MPRCSGCCFDGSWLSSSACGVVAHTQSAGWLLGWFGVLGAAWWWGGREFPFSTAPRGFTGACSGFGQASSPCKGVQCCPRAVSEAAGTCCQDCALQHHRHPGLSPVPQLSDCTLQQAPGTSPAHCPCCLQQCLPPNPPGLHHHVPHSKQMLARSSCSTERWGYLPALPIPTSMYCFGKSTSSVKSSCCLAQQLTNQ